MLSGISSVLTIAGSDSGGGAGIQADLKTFAALGCFGMTVITAVTAQNTREVKAIYPLPATVVSQQLEAIFSDMRCDVIKIGMLFNKEIIEAVQEKLSPSIAVVLDPVMCAKGGGLLLQREAIPSLVKLFPISLVITPNLEEASAFLGYPVTQKEQMEKAARELLDLGAQNVLLKGGHLLGEQKCDCFCSKTGEISWIEQPFVKTKNTHGTGCTLASAIAAYLAKKYPLKEAIEYARLFLHSALRKSCER